MHWASGAWRIQPVPERFDYTFTADNPRPMAPAEVGGRLKVAGFNVLNYFTTIDDGTPGCGPGGGLGCRGADSEAELARQRDKIVAAMVAIGAHVFGVVEIENNDSASLAHLVAGLNAAADPGTYVYVDTGTIGSDVIKVGLIYQPARVTPVGPHTIIDSSVDTSFVDAKNRPGLIQTFEEVASGERFTVAVNHFKSKGSSCDELGDPDLRDGQGNCNGTRTAAAEALARYLATDPTASGDPDILIVGDLNAYAREDPIGALQAAGYTDLIRRFVGADAYGYLFDGQLGYLDHALASPSLLRQVTGVTGWRINADEPPLFDYNDDVHDAGEREFERKSAALPIYEANAFRSSDHDPVIVGLQLEKGPKLGRPTPTGEAPVADPPFTDLAIVRSAAHRDDIRRIYGLGITVGTSGTTFSPRAARVTATGGFLPRPAVQSRGGRWTLRLSRPPYSEIDKCLGRPPRRHPPHLWTRHHGRRPVRDHLPRCLRVPRPDGDAAGQVPYLGDEHSLVPVVRDTFHGPGRGRDLARGRHRPHIRTRYHARHLRHDLLPRCLHDPPADGVLPGQGLPGSFDSR